MIEYKDKVSISPEMSHMFRADGYMLWSTFALQLAGVHGGRGCPP